MKTRTKGLLACILAFGLLATSVPATASTTDDPSGPDLTEVEQETLTDIFGYEPSPDEQSNYLDQYGSVPTKAQIAAYLAAERGPRESSSARSAPSNSLAMRAGTFSSYFKSSQWITRDGMVSLSLMPRDGGIGNESQSGTWDTVKGRYGSSVKWKNTAKMKEQYDCHFKYGMIKTPWNLEPSRTSVNFITCN